MNSVPVPTLWPHGLPTMSCPAPEKLLQSVCMEGRFTVMHSEKLQPGYLPSVCELAPYSVLPQKSSHTEDESIMATAKSSSQVICSLLMSLLSAAQSCPRKAGTWHALGGLSLLWLIGKGCYKVICPLSTPLSTRSVPVVELCSVAPSWPFVLGEAKYALPNVLWEEE